ncbi:MAG: acetyl-CoA hydrolase/transferase C-terminal domain-containing protein [Gammaproteobacteria bacterium]|nr:acetyl-CoA hydrolase/transferase C-terminal domain-containing protein [Gammaproteobacteria bacterium]
MTLYHNHYDLAAQKIIADVGKTIIIGVPLALGKPIGLLNALYRLASQDPTLSLTIMTALTLGRPELNTDLEKRFIEPFLDRVLQDYEELLYENARINQQLPANIRVIEFFLSPGKYLKNNYVQQNYISANYTNAVRDLHSYGVNVVAQLVAHSKINPNEYSVSCNSDLFQDAVNQMKKTGAKCAVVAEVNNNLPFMYGEAVIPSETFTDIIDTGEYRTLFSLPHDELSISDHLIGLYTSTLIKDDGCLQVGIGKLSTAVTNALIFRHKNNDLYHELLKKMSIVQKFGDIISAVGETGTFEKGLYASTEMLGDDYMSLYEENILKKQVYDHIGLQTLLNTGQITETVSPQLFSVLLKNHLIHSTLTVMDVDFLVKFGIFQDGIRYENDYILTADGKKISADLNDDAVKNEIMQSCLGTHLKTGKIVHAAFILGSQDLYQKLHDLTFQQAQAFDMTTIDRTNTLIWSRDLLTLQRKNMRFVNSAMMVTLGSVVVSDGLNNLQEVSGIGGQFDFMEMAQALKDSRAIINCRSTRKAKNGLASNIVWEYSNISVPRFLRDIVITEYGIADCRSKTDADIIKAMLNITDSRFQAPLLATAKLHGKIPVDYEIPSEYQNNYPHIVEASIKALQKQGYFQAFPFGTEFTPDEIVLEHALLKLKSESQWQLLRLVVQSLFYFGKDKSYERYLQRMDLLKPRNMKEWIYKKLLKFILKDEVSQH